MRIAVIQASSQKDKNPLLVKSVESAVKNQGHQVYNFGIFPEETLTYSYVQVALQISMLLESGAVDFAVTGCSSGQGMMLACNSLPGILCGYVENPSDAFLFGRINNGNAVSFPLGLNFGWAAEINLQSTMEKLFAAPFGSGYPKEEAARKTRDAEMLKNINGICKRSLTEILPQLEEGLVRSALGRKMVFDFIMEYGTEESFKTCLQALVL